MDISGFPPIPFILSLQRLQKNFSVVFTRFGAVSSARFSTGISIYLLPPSVITEKYISKIILVHKCWKGYKIVSWIYVYIYLKI